jgi:cobalt-zinc-cadmium efflux system membrane fusion protein
MSLSCRLFVVPFLVCAGLSAASEPLVLQAAQIKALGIETAVVGEADAARKGTLPASVLIPNEQMRIVSAPVGGMLEMLAVAPGDVVKRGQVIARLSSPQALELQRDALQSSAQANLQNQNLKRDEQLFAEGLIAESRLQATRAAAAQAAAMASERRQGLSLAGLAPGKLGEGLALTAPIDGVVLEQGAQLGKRVEPSALIYRIAKLSPLWLEVQAPVDLAATLQAGMPVRVANSKVSGKLIAIGRAVDAASQTVLLRVSVDTGAEALRPGQVVEVEIEAGSAGTAGTAAKQARIPATALARNQGVALVFVQTASDEKGTGFSARPVRIVSQGGEGVVVDGIANGERIAVRGVSGLKAMLSGVGKE